jgi:ubiquinone/menaquinone biosynthesis C-methylase UbiE
MTSYYQRVAEYFDQDAPDFDSWYWGNPVLQRIRQGFREVVKRHRFITALELGCGTGLDLSHFGRIYPGCRFFGMDVSPAMVRLARAKVSDHRLSNVEVAQGSVEQIEECFPGQRFDLVYVFFGALNTVESLPDAADILYRVIAPGGVLVISMVNRWYVADMLINLLRGRWRQARRRLGHVWGGYSPTRRLETRCYGPQQVATAFGREGFLVRHRGFSIAYPPWYRAHWVPRIRRLGRWLWELDKLISRTPLWSCCEYALYVYRSARVPAGAGPETPLSAMLAHE